MTLLKVRNLKVYYFTLEGIVQAVDDVSFELNDKEALGLVGESGSGKSTVVWSLMRLVPSPGRILEGEVFLEGVDLLRISESEMRKIRWKKISMVFQSALSALNPLHKVGDQIAEALLLHEDVSKDEAHKRAKELMEMVGLGPSRSDNYPYEFSGGMKQRVLLAMSLACNPKVVLADEPVTALDVMVSAQVMELIKHLQESTKMSLILISHDLSVVAEVCDRLAIMYAGKIVEYTDSVSFFKNPVHPYSLCLIKAFPRISGPKNRLESAPGNSADLLNPPPGCRFHPRCRYAKSICREEEPRLIETGKGHVVACHFADEVRKM